MEKKNISYHEKKYIDNNIRHQKYSGGASSVCTGFLQGRQTTLSMQTQIAYCYDLKIFFQFLTTAIPL